jgi:thiol-disulfide isomerase/thioredoxin
MKKLLLILVVIGLIACLFVGCTPTTPSEGEGEGEGEEELARVVLVEIFSQSGCAYCEIVEPFLEQLADEYTRDEMVLVEERAYGLYSSNEIRDRYEWYFPSVSDRSTPNVLFNGLNQRIHGSSTYLILKSKIETELAKEAKIEISATRDSVSTTNTISGTIKNISSSALSNLVINGMTLKDRGQMGLKYCVADIFEEQKETVATLEPGESYSFSFSLDGFDWEGNNMHGVIFVQAPDSDKKEVFQTFYID